MKPDADIVLLPDIHSDRELAERRQSFIEITEPDVLVRETQISDEKMEMLWTYRNFEQIYRETGLLEGEPNIPDPVQEPLYELSENEINQMLDPIDELDESEIEDAEGLQTVIDHLTKNKKNNEPFFELRLACTYFNRMKDGREFTIDSGDDRRRAAVVAAYKGEFPDNDADIIERNIRKHGTHFPQMSESKRKKYFEFITSKEATKIRDHSLAKTLEDHSTHNDYIIGTCGIAHIEGIIDNLSEDYDILIGDLRGEDSSDFELYSPDEWNYNVSVW